MKSTYLFSSPLGDIPVGPSDLKKPFRLSLSEKHEFLTLGDYFRCIEHFLYTAGLESLSDLFAAPASTDENRKEQVLERIVIRAEKHGALYHMASADLFKDSEMARVCIASAISTAGKRYLENEYELIRRLNRETGLSYLPCPYVKTLVDCHCHDRCVKFLMAAYQWFDDFHEWHFSRDESTGLEIRLWDTKRGHRWLKRDEALQLFSKISFILTMYYNVKTMQRIGPWHNGAGDFILRTSKQPIEVRLTTVRGYEPLFSDTTIDPFIGLIYFFLEHTIQIRMDRLNGIEEPVWAPKEYLEAAVSGLFRALEKKEGNGNPLPAPAHTIEKTLADLDGKEIRHLYHPIEEEYRHGPESQWKIINHNLDSHVEELAMAIKDACQ